MLYDTYGFRFPELSQEIAAEHGLTVELEGFEAAMEEQTSRSQEAHETIDLTAPDFLNQQAAGINATQFLGYTQPSTPAQVTTLIANSKPVESAEAGTEVQVMLDQTPFYAESGGQIGDRGYLSGDSVLVRIEDVQQKSGIYIHYGRIERGTLKLATQSPRLTAPAAFALKPITPPPPATSGIEKDCR